MSSFTTKVIVVIPARNEEVFLPKTLKALLSQTHPIERIIVVNDGSTDNTEIISKSYNKVFVLNREDRGFDAVGKAILAETFNAGFKKAIELISDYSHMLVVGADAVLSENYVESILSEFSKDPSLVIASGIITGKINQPISSFHVYGSGRLIIRWFWEKLEESYPVKVGWESYPVFKANEIGYRTKAFHQYSFKLQRITGKRTDYYAYGEAMRALGYFWLLAIGRSLKQLLRNPSSGLSMLWGFVRGKERYEDSLRRYVNKIQKKRIKKLFLPF